jgi:2',3'-cyclic-nucleotide 2'-phosphodiesterase (5'-nucleotidase family)
MKLQRFLIGIINMKNIIILSVLVLSILAGCKGSKDAGGTIIDDSIKDDGLITIQFIQVNDVYEIAPLGGGLYGGMERVAYVADSVKALNKNTMLVMAGDFLNPSLLGTIKVDGERLKGKQMVDVMNAMDFDLVTFGNHEFDIGQEDLQKRLNESNFPWTSANVQEIRSVGALPFVLDNQLGVRTLPETYTRTFTDKDGTTIDVGFFSVTVASNPVDFIHYNDPVDSSKKAYSELKDKTDLVLGFTHLTLAEDKEVADAIPELKFIMGGHEHSSMLVPHNNAIIAKADANAKTAYIHTLTYNKNTKNLEIDSHLRVIDDRTPSDPEVKVIVDKWNNLLEEKIKEVIDNPYEVIYTSNPPLDGTDSANRSIQTDLGDMITSAMKYAYRDDIDAAIVNGGSIRIDDMLPNKVASMDIFRTLPFGGSIVKVKITGTLLKEVLDFGKQSRGTGAYLQYHTISENPTYGWNVGGNEIETEKVYTVAFSDFLLKGYDIPFLNRDNIGVLEVYHPKENELAYDIRKAIITYLKTLK